MAGGGLIHSSHSHSSHSFHAAGRRTDAHFEAKQKWPVRVRNGSNEVRWDRMQEDICIFLQIGIVEKGDTMVVTEKRTRFDAPALKKDEQTQKRGRRRQRLPRLEEFMDLEVSHPYGILPGGNQFTTTNHYGVTIGGTSSNSLLSKYEEVCHHILSFCDGRDLARVSQCSRFLYAACHQLELWRDLVLRHLESQNKRQRLSSESTTNNAHVLTFL